MVENGKLPSNVLVKLSTPGYLLSGAAASYERLLLATGTTGTTYDNQAYRDYEEQVVQFKKNYTTTYTQYKPGITDRRIWLGTSWYRKKGCVSAAVPGTSNHGLGIAVDFQGLGDFNSASWKAFDKEATIRGWSASEGKAIDEPWHRVYNITEDQFKNQPAKKGLVEMFVTKYGSSQFVLVTGDRAVLVSSTTFSKLTAAGVPSCALDNSEVANLLKVLTPEIGSGGSVPATSFSVVLDGTVTPKA